MKTVLLIEKLSSFFPALSLFMIFGLSAGVETANSHSTVQLSAFDVTLGTTQSDTSIEALTENYILELNAALEVAALKTPSVATQQEDPDTSAALIPISEWLLAGPFPAMLPAYNDVPGITGSTFKVADLLHFPHADLVDLHPEAGQSIRVNTTQRPWQTVGASPDLAAPVPPGTWNIFYAATYLHATRWMEVTLSLKGSHAFAVYLNGDRVAGKTAFDEHNREEPGSISQKLTLTQGQHRLVVKYLVASEGPLPTLTGHLDAGDSNHDRIRATLSPRGPVSLQHMVDTPMPMSVSVSPDGNLTAVMMRQSRPADNTWENWIELMRTDSGERVATWRGGMNISGMSWAPSGQRFSYTTRSGGKGTIWVVDLERGTHLPVLRDIERLGGHSWSPDGSFMVYSVSEQQRPDGSGVALLDGMHDRYPTWRTRSFLYRLDLASGSRQRLTAGILTTSLGDISPDGTKLVFSRSHVDYSERPFTRVEMVMLDLQTLQTEVLFETPWIGGGSFSPDGRTLLLTGSPNAFDGLGSIVEGLSNDYDTQVYLYDLQNRTPKFITAELDRTVNSAAWNRDGRYVYIGVDDGSKSAVFRYEVRTERLTRIETGNDMVTGFSLAAGADRAAFVGHGMSDTRKAYTVDLRRDRVRLLSDPSAGDFRNVNWGASRDWVYTTAEGDRIDGHVYYPVDFDPDRKYPVIVYYYGGTAPVTRAFGGRYPKELYAAHGYIVYVMQPSGSTGYGQEFAARHLNDWGIRVSGEIIESTQAFLEAHPYADADRVGAMGASFGGFMTKLLLTETDMFAAAVSHAGISNITSYWGEGFWGYLYSSVASANSYPWDAPHIYVDQSPVFRADRVNTPLLLTTGMDDTNVPPGESIQFYTALKLLGKEVEFLKVDGQDHHIVDYNKFNLWKTHIMAWFDRWLKDEPEWWESLSK
jgi:dipeptidyl aminopeptidase/acylaminoacyl peptidase